MSKRVRSKNPRMRRSGSCERKFGWQKTATQLPLRPDLNPLFLDHPTTSPRTLILRHGPSPESTLHRWLPDLTLTTCRAFASSPTDREARSSLALHRDPDLCEHSQRPSSSAPYCPGLSLQFALTRTFIPSFHLSNVARDFWLSFGSEATAAESAFRSPGSGERFH